jgi:YD repeat-containing protein
MISEPSFLCLSRCPLSTAPLPPALLITSCHPLVATAGFASSFGRSPPSTTISPTAQSTYTLNARNGLASIGDGSTTTASFVYDGLGRRAGKTLAGAATEFLYDGLNPVQEISGGTRARTC